MCKKGEHMAPGGVEHPNVITGQQLADKAKELGVNSQFVDRNDPDFGRNPYYIIGDSVNSNQQTIGK